ncbi:hypothetical protein ACHAQJ_004979 [Trichoderma viride]
MDQLLLGHGGVNFVELTKTNLQFIYGKDVLIEILSQVNGPDTWKITVVKTEDGVRNFGYSASGVGLIKVLENLHRKSAEMLSKHIYDTSKADAEASVKRKKPKADEAAAAKTAKKPVPMKDYLDPYFMNMASDFEIPPVEYPDCIHGWTGKRGELYESDPYEIPNIDHLSRDTMFPGYPAYYGSTWDSCGDISDDMTPRAADQQKSKARAAETVQQDRAKQLLKSALAADGIAEDAAKMATASLRERHAMSQAEHAAIEASTAQIARRMLLGKQRDTQPRYSVILHIQWDGYAEAVVADECQLSVKAVKSRVRYMLRNYGRGLFGDAASKMPPAPFAPAEIVNFNVMVKGMRVNDDVFVLGPNFGDDLSSMLGNVKPVNQIKLEISLMWNGEEFAKNSNKPAIAAASTSAATTPASTSASTSASASATTADAAK